MVMKKLEGKQLVKLIGNEAFYHAYQPLYVLADWTVLGYEACIRSQYFAIPKHFFKHAMQLNKLYELDILSFSRAILSYKSCNKTSHNYLFVNLFFSTLFHQDFRRFLDDALSNDLIPNGRIVLKINGGEEITDYKSIQNTLSFLRKNGLRIALDNVGKEAASLKRLVEIEPDFIKLDKYFSVNLSESTKKQKLIESLLYYCNNDAHLILDGIEKLEDLATAKALKVNIGQGYILGKPEVL